LFVDIARTAGAAKTLLRFIFSSPISPACARKLFPQLAAAYQTWLEKGDPAELQRVSNAGCLKWQASARRMIELFQQHGEAAGPLIERMLEPA
jgi:hypothetical protein